MKLIFTTPCAFNGDALAASFGFAGAPAPEEAAVRVAPVELEGVLLTGTYNEILAAIDEIPNQAGIVLPGNAGGEDDSHSQGRSSV